MLVGGKISLAGIQLMQTKQEGEPELIESRMRLQIVSQRNHFVLQYAIEIGFFTQARGK